MPQFDLVPKFTPGHITITAHAAAHLSSPDVTTALRRHLQADWGDLAFADKLQNERALAAGGCLCSAYRSSRGLRFYVITEADRSVTTVLLPDEY
jgi:hypothetical protein